MRIIKLKFSNDEVVSLSILCSLSGVLAEEFCQSVVLKCINEYSDLIHSNQEMVAKIKAMLPSEISKGNAKALLDHYRPCDSGDENGAIFLTREFLLPYFPGVRQYKLKEKMVQIGFSQSVAKVDGVAQRGYWAIKQNQDSDENILSFL